MLFPTDNIWYVKFEKKERGVIMKVLFEKCSFKRNDGQVVEYYRYYVEIMGVKVYLKPVDSTGSNLLTAFINGGVK